MKQEKGNLGIFVTIMLAVVLMIALDVFFPQLFMPKDPNDVKVHHQ